MNWRSAIIFILSLLLLTLNPVSLIAPRFQFTDQPQSILSDLPHSSDTAVSKLGLNTYAGKVEWTDYFLQFEIWKLISIETA